MTGVQTCALPIFYLPAETSIRLLITGMDVIHSWAVPSFGVKTDAIPGRLNQTWLYCTSEGTYYGQCSELCGVNHAFMPIHVVVVEPDIFFDDIIYNMIDKFEPEWCKKHFLNSEHGYIVPKTETILKSKMSAKF